MIFITAKNSLVNFNHCVWESFKNIPFLTLGIVMIRKIARNSNEYLFRCIHLNSWKGNSASSYWIHVVCKHSQYIVDVHQYLELRKQIWNEDWYPVWLIWPYLLNYTSYFKQIIRVRFQNWAVILIWTYLLSNTE